MSRVNKNKFKKVLKEPGAIDDFWKIVGATKKGRKLVRSWSTSPKFRKRKTRK